MGPDDAENSVRERLEGLGYEVEKLETREAYGLKTADFSAVLDREALVIDVKARQFDGEVEEKMRDGERLIEVFKRLDEGTEEHTAVARFLHGSLQIEETRTNEREIGVVWMFTSEAVGMRVDAPRLHWHLLGMRPIFVENGRGRKPVLRVHEPLFGEVDLLVIEDATRRLNILVNPWIPAEHRATVLASPLYRSADK